MDYYGPVKNPSKLSRDTLHPNLNPPFQTVVMVPLGLLPYGTAFWVWSLLSLAAGLAGATVVARIHHPIRMRAKDMAAAWLLLLLYFPTFATIIYGQFSLVLLLLLAIVWYAARRGTIVSPGFALGLALSLKLFVGLLLILFLVRRRWRALGWTVGTAVACALIALVVAGPGAYRSYFEVMGSVTWYGASWNASFMGFFTRIFGGSENVPWINAPGLAHALAYGCSALVALGLAWLARRPHDDQRDPAAFDLAFAFGLVAMLLASPLGWMYYFPVLLITATVGWEAARRSGRRSLLLLIPLAWILSTTPHALIPVSTGEMDNPFNWFTWAGVYFYALLIFAGALLWLGRMRVKAPPANH